eukprot:m.151402 g.151402  ORF g.151402 m.151402 type:complete len:764 (-) comp16199_c4_seq2:5237-7528(-)
MLPAQHNDRDTLLGGSQPSSSATETDKVLGKLTSGVDELASISQSYSVPRSAANHSQYQLMLRFTVSTMHPYEQLQSRPSGKRSKNIRAAKSLLRQCFMRCSFFIVLCLCCIDMTMMAMHRSTGHSLYPAAMPTSDQHTIRTLFFSIFTPSGSFLALPTVLAKVAGNTVRSPPSIVATSDLEHLYLPELPYTPTFAQADALKFHKANNTRILVMINGDCESAARIGPVVYRTWNRLPGSQFVTVKFIIGDSRISDGPCSNDPLVEEHLITYTPRCSDAYPPVSKVLCMWEFARQEWQSSYDFFLKTDADTYLNIPNLLVLLAEHSPGQDLFAGAVGTGRNRDLPPYCLGPAYIVSRYTLGRLPYKLSEAAVILPNSDTTFSQLIRDQLNVVCMDRVHGRFKWAFMNRYWDFQDGEFVTMQLNDKNQMILPVVHALNSALLPTISVHPLKRQEDMVSLHNAILYSRLPLFRFPTPQGETPVAGQLANLCVYNPSIQYELSGMKLRECAAVRPVRPRKLVQGYVAYLRHRRKSSDRASAIASQLRDMGITPALFSGVDGFSMLTSQTKTRLNPGELGLRETYRLMFYDILRNPKLGDDLFLIVEDDVVFSPEFKSQLDMILQDPRCGSYMSSNTGGVLLLGATIWRNGSYPKVNMYTGGWIMADLDMEEHPGSKCYNFNSGVYGTFAFIVDRRAARMMLEWLNDPRYADLPIDHSYNFLSEQGLPVRVAFPYLVIPRVDTSIIHKSGTHTDAARRAEIHRWFFQS